MSDDEDEDKEDEEDEEVEDEDMDDIYGTESRFPAGFRPMWMCRWYPNGNCRQGRGCMFAHSVNELHPKLVVKCPNDFYWGDGFWKMSMYSAPCLVRLWIHGHASVHVTFGRFLRWYFYSSFFWQSLVRLFLLEEYKYAVFLGVDFGKCRTQRFLV